MQMVTLLNYSTEICTSKALQEKHPTMHACFAESHRAVRELRRPGGGKPHGEVRSMTIPAGAQVS